MCDTCNRRAPDFLLRCRVCPFYVCKACVFADMLEGDGKHFVDIAETDWSTIDTAPKRTTKRPRAAARSQPSNPDTTSSVSAAASPFTQHQPRLPSLRDLFPPEFFQPPTSATMPRRQAGGDEDEDYMPDEEYMPHSKRHKSLTRRASQEELSATDSQYSESQGDLELDEAYTAASYRPNPRRSATVAYDRISQTSRTSRQPHRVEQQQELSHGQQSESRRSLQQNQSVEEQQTSRNRVTCEVSRASRHVHFAGPQQQDHRRAPQSQIASNVPVRPSPLSNMSLLRDFEHPSTELTAASGRPVRGAMARALDRMSNQNQAGSSSAVNPAEEDFRSDAPGRPAKPPISREQQRKQNLIMVLYRSIFDSKLKEFPSLMTFRPIPDTWQEPSSLRAASPAPPPPNTPLNLNNIPQRAEFDAFHQHSLSSTLRMQTPYGGPAVPVPPLGYESYSFQNYPSTHKTNDHEYYSTAANDVFGQAVPSLRTTPKYHPTNEMTPEETQRYHNDRRLFVKMKAAWVDNDKVLRLREQKVDGDALQTLWEVAQVFRARNPVNPSAESVKWFVDKRDEISRPRSQSQRQSQSAPAEESGHDNLEDLVNAAAAAEELEVVGPEPMDVDEPEQQEDDEEMPQQAENDEEDDDDEYVDVDELAPAFRMLQQLEQQQQQQQQPPAASVSPPSIHSQDYDADVDTPSETQSEIEDHERHERARSERAQSKGRLGINDLLN